MTKRILAATLITTLALLMTAPGCKFSNPFKTHRPEPIEDAPPAESAFAVQTDAKTSASPKYESSPPAQPARTVDAPPFQGFHLTVWLDGMQTRPAGRTGGAQLWSIARASGQPMLMFNTDTAALGPVRGVNLAIHPVGGDGKVQSEIFWRPGALADPKPGQEIRLQRFDRITPEGIQRGLAALPTGRYRMNLQVNGEKSWDRQQIDFVIE